MRTLIRTGIVLALAAFIGYRYFFYVDFAYGCSVSITPSLTEFSNTNIKRALGVLKEAVPDDYRSVCVHVGNINPNFSCGGFGGGCFWPSRFDTNPRSIDVSTSKDDLAWTASVIVHESCHAQQFRERRPLDETECHLAGDRVLRVIVEL